MSAQPIAETPRKRICLRLRYNPTGETLRWSIWREPAMYSTENKSRAPSRHGPLLSMAEGN